MLTTTGLLRMFKTCRDKALWEFRKAVEETKLKSIAFQSQEKDGLYLVEEWYKADGSIRKRKQRLN